VVYKLLFFYFMFPAFLRWTFPGPDLQTATVMMDCYFCNGHKWGQADGIGLSSADIHCRSDYYPVLSVYCRCNKVSFWQTDWSRGWVCKPSMLTAWFVRTDSENPKCGRVVTAHLWGNECLGLVRDNEWQRNQTVSSTSSLLCGCKWRIFWANDYFLAA